MYVLYFRAKTCTSRWVFLSLFYFYTILTCWCYRLSNQSGLDCRLYTVPCYHSIQQHQTRVQRVCVACGWERSEPLKHSQYQLGDEEVIRSKDKPLANMHCTHDQFHWMRCWNLPWSIWGSASRTQVCSASSTHCKVSEKNHTPKADSSQLPKGTIAAFCNLSVIGLCSVIRRKSRITVIVATFISSSFSRWEYTSCMWNPNHTQNVGSFQNMFGIMCHTLLKDLNLVNMRQEFFCRLPISFEALQIMCNTSSLWCIDT